MVKGFKQECKIDYNEVFLPIVKMTTLQSVDVLVAIEDMNLHQMDVNKTFIYKNLHEELYLQHPKGFFKKGKEKLVCHLKKSLCGLK